MASFTSSERWISRRYHPVGLGCGALSTDVTGTELVALIADFYQVAAPQ